MLLKEFVPEFDRLGVRILGSDEAVVRDVDAIYDAVFYRLEGSFASDQIPERERDRLVKRKDKASTYPESAKFATIFVRLLIICPSLELGKT